MEAAAIQGTRHQISEVHQSSIHCLHNFSLMQ
jgi:hypothetical protein